MQMVVFSNVHSVCSREPLYDDLTSWLLIFIILHKNYEMDVLIFHKLHESLRNTVLAMLLVSTIN